MCRGKEIMLLKNSKKYCWIGKEKTGNNAVNYVF